jgi:hypothetical protein
MEINIFSLRGSVHHYPLEWSNMTPDTQRRQHDQHSAVNPMMASAVGAAVGAATVFLMDRNNRRRMMEVIETAVKRAREGADDAKRIATDAVADLETQVDHVRSALPGMAEKVRQTAKQKAGEVRENTERAAGQTADRAKKMTEDANRKVK